MAARTNDELTLWRSQTKARFHAYFHKPEVVFRARVNQASFTYPISQITFDTVTTGAYTDLEPWMTIGFSAYADDGADAGRTFIRPASNGVVATSSVINIGRVSQGTREGEVNLGDSYYVTVWNHRKIWAVPPFNTLDPDSPTSYRWGSWAFDDEYCFPPVANLGPDVLKIVEEDTDTALIDFGQVASYPTHPDATSSLTYAWDFRDGTPSTSSDAAPADVEFPVGARYVSLTVTDSLGTTNTGYRLVVVADRAHADLIPIAIVNHLQRLDGQEIQARLLDERSYTTYIDGAEVLIAAEERYGSTAGSIGNIPDREHMVGTFYIDTENHTGEGSPRGWKRNTRIRLIDAANRCKQIPGFPQVVQRDAAPAVWEQMEGATIDRYVHFIGHWHSNIFTRHDFVWSGTNTSYPFTQLSSPGATLWEQLSLRTQAIRHQITCDQHGVIRMTKDNLLLPTSGQASAYSLPVARTSTTTLQLTSTDLAGIRWDYLYHPRGHWNWGSAVVASTDDADTVEDIPSVFCVSPGFAPGQGAASQDIGEQLVNATTGQAELNIVEGNRYQARTNAVVGNLVLDLTRMGNIGVDPALGEWVTLPASMSTTMRGRTIAGRRVQVFEIQWTYDHSKGTRKQSWGCEIEETTGTPAVAYTPATDDGIGVYPPVEDPVEPPGFPGLPGAGINKMALICQNGLAWTANFQSASPTWSYASWASLSVSGFVLNWVPDGFNPGEGWIFTTTKIYHFVLSTRVATEKHSWAGTMRSVSADASFSEEGFVCAVGYSSSAGTIAVSTQDSFSTLVSAGEVLITNQIASDYISYGIANGCHLSSRSGRILTSAYTSSGSIGSSTTVQAIYASTDHGATWGVLSSPTTVIGDMLAHCIHVPWHNNTNEDIIYTSQINDSAYRAYRNGTDISPLSSGEPYAPRSIRYGIQTSVVNRQQAMMVGQTEFLGNPAWAVFVSSNGGDSWSAVNWGSVFGTGIDAKGCALAGDSPNVGWIWGSNNYLKQVTINSNSGILSDKAGNLSTHTVGTIYAIAGY